MEALAKMAMMVKLAKMVLDFHPMLFQWADHTGYNNLFYYRYLQMFQ